MSRAITLECYDWNLIKKDDFIGSVEIRLSDILEQGACDDATHHKIF